MTLGEKIKNLRKGKYTQEELAYRIGVHVNTLIRWERGDTTPTVDKLKSIADALGTTSDYLLGESVVSASHKDKVPFESVSPNVDDAVGKRLIIKQGDLYINLPESSEGFDALRRFFDSQTAKTVALSPATVQA